MKQRWAPSFPKINIFFKNTLQFNNITTVYSSWFYQRLPIIAVACLQFSVSLLPSLKVGEVHLTAMYATQILANMILVKVPISVVSSVFCNEPATPRATLDWKPDEFIMPFMQPLLSSAAQGGRGDWSDNDRWSHEVIRGGEIWHQM